MKIVAVEVYLGPFTEDPKAPNNRNYPFVKVTTDDGIHGVGEAYTVGPDLATVKAISYFGDWLIGRDPMGIEGLWQLMYSGSRFPTGSVLGAAISGIEHALWDIKGKALGVPVYELIGGRCRDKVRVYQGVGGRTPKELAENAVSLVERYGYTGLKTSPWPQEGDTVWHDMGYSEMIKGAERRISALRDAVGDSVDIGLDAHAQSFEPAKALSLCQMLVPYYPMFLEEPLRAENRAAMGYLRSKSPIPIATGEALFTKFEFRDLLANQAADIVQPDVCVVGGLWEMKKIAAMAEAEYVMVAPHNPCGPVANAVNFHFAMSTQNFLILEYRPDDAPHRRSIVHDPIALEDGYLLPNNRPGLGVEIDFSALQGYKYNAWHRPFLWRMDGSFGYQ